MTSAHLLAEALALVGAGLAAERLARALRLPDIVLFLLAGVLLGPVAGVVRIGAAGPAAQFVLTFGAAFMLYEGGRGLTLAMLRRIWRGLALLSTLGVLITAAVMAAAARLTLHLPWPEAGLLAAVVASTDPASIVPLFREVHVRRRLARLVEAESACNDAVAAVLTFTLLEVSTGHPVSLAGGIGLFAWKVVGGIVAGAACGAAAAWLTPGRRGLGLFGTHEQAGLLALATVLGAYLAATVVHASGFMSVFAAGVATGNRHLLEMTAPTSHRRGERAFLGYASILVRMSIFVVVGDVLDLHVLWLWAAPALLLSGVLLFVARPATVFACLPVDRAARWSRGEMLFAAWVRETGVVPAALAGALLQQGAPGAGVIAATVFTVVLCTMLLQVPTTRWWARVLGVSGAG